MRVLVTGHHGYIGSVMCDELRNAGHRVSGVDTFYFKGKDFVPRGDEVPSLARDVRDVTRQDLEGYDAVVHLAALSNDPTGDLDPALTAEINHQASVRLAMLAKEAGVSRFLFSSSCSVYGVANNTVAHEGSLVAPLTAYARSKVATENDVSVLADDGFTPVFLRNATAFGVSPRMRFDLVVNNMAGSAATEGIIAMQSDGTPWRPVVHIQDISRAFVRCLDVERDVLRNRVLNIGGTEGNYQVKDIAAILGKTFGTDVACLNQAPSDQRSYRVSFSTAESVLGFRPTWTVADAGRELQQAFEAISFDRAMFRDPFFTNLVRMKQLVAEQQLDPGLRWNSTARA